MAVVYLAHDLKHDRPVALKVLNPELAATLAYFLSPRWLGVDPTFDELCTQPCFQKLVEGTT